MPRSRSPAPKSGQTGGAGPFISPGAGDPWLDDITNRTLDLTDDSGDGHGDVHATYAISGDTVTLSVSANATSGGTIGAQVSGSTAGMSWCAEFDKYPNAWCQKHQVIQAGSSSDLSNGCTTYYVDVATDPGTNQACIDSAATQWGANWSATAGDPYNPGGGSASMIATYTVTATKTP